jgi:[protein-PII] uridylyltransferase
MPLDHSVRTIDQAVAVADEDLRAALGLLDVRHVAGDASLSTMLRERLLQDWRAKAKKRLPELKESGDARAREQGEVAFLLEPDLKLSRGGLRDVETLRALAAAWVTDAPAPPVREAHSLLLDVRGELHRLARGRNKLLLQEQEGVAAALDIPTAESLALAVAHAGRTISWAWDAAWHRANASIAPARWRGRKPIRRPLDEGVVEQDGEITLARDVDVTQDPILVLRAAAAAARTQLPFAPYTLERLGREAPPMPDPWPHAGRDALVSVLAAGRGAVAAFEALDSVGILVRLLPDWEHVRSRPQRNPYHRYTVDRHLVECAANAAALTRGVDRPDLLLLGALFHDIGKGLPGDHTDVGVHIVTRLGPQLSLDPEDAEVLASMVRHHLLLADVATRRDLSDPATIKSVANAVGSHRVLHLLAALTEADSLATGVSAWGPWKATLVNELVDRVETVLGGNPPPPPPPLTAAQQELMQAAGTVVSVTPGEWELAQVSVSAVTQRGLFAAVTGVVALHRYDVRQAIARTDGKRDLVELTVTTRVGRPPDPERLRTDLLSALEGRVSLADRLAERDRHEPARRGPAPAPPSVSFDDASEGSTVIEVRAPDRPGVLHQIVTALTAANAVVSSAFVTTLGADAIDSFYVQLPTGGPIDDEADRDRISAAVLTALTPPDVAGAQSSGTGSAVR